MDDAIANGTLQLPPGAPQPLALFRAARIDYSLHRLYHYTSTAPEHFQNFVIFTNYQFYVDAFARSCRERIGSGEPGIDAFVDPGNVTTRSIHLGGGTTGVAPDRLPQMPAFHLVESAIGASLLSTSELVRPMPALLPTTLPCSGHTPG